ncbi:MAG: diadenylate cyclase CdaA [Treponema sp.]|nr:diadenylate cyclase CdaA [Treponema sp.]MBQ5384447.1 diadenylate cyclase CdaA [Treponema sp.]
MSGSLTSVGKFFLRGLDFVLLFLLIYEIFRLLRRTNSLLMLKAAIIIGLSGLVISGLNLPILSWLIRKLGPTVITAFVIVFQPEIRKIIVKMGNINFLSFRGKKSAKYTEEKISSVLDAAEELSRITESQPKSRGMLLVFLRSDPMVKIVNDDSDLNGEELNADISKNLLVTIFKYDTPLHDGACIIQDNKIIRAGSHLPLSEHYDIKKSTFGTRHCAALGASEKSDAVALVVSEETGYISLAYDGRLYYNLTRTELEQTLNQLLGGKTVNPVQDGVQEIKR